MEYFDLVYQIFRAIIKHLKQIKDKKKNENFK